MRKNFAYVFTIQNHVEILVFVIQVKVNSRGIRLRIVVESCCHSTNQSESTDLIEVLSILEAKYLLGESVDQIILYRITISNCFVLAFPVCDFNLAI